MLSEKYRDWSKELLGWGSAITATIIGLGLLGILGNDINIQDVTNAVMLIFLGSVLFAEFYTEKASKNIVSTGNYIMVVLSAFAILTGIITLVNGIWNFLDVFPSQILGAMGLLYIILAVVLIVKIYQ
jgi:hypothetical protein